MESVRIYPDIAPLGPIRRPVERVRESSRPLTDAQAIALNALAIIVNGLSATGFTLAAAFTSQFVLMTTIWQGIALGAITYSLFIFVGGFCGDV